MAEFKFPTETVDLPSKGYLYVEGHPLSSGKVEIKYMTAKEEDILTSQNLIQQGTVIDTLLQALIMDKTINVNDLLIGDKNAIMVAARILGYGKEYEFEYEGKEQEVDLSKLNPKKIDFKKMTRGVNEFSFELPTSKRTITFKLLTGNAQITINLRKWPADTASSSPLGPFTVTSSTEKVDTRARSRFASLKIANTSTGENWRYGTFRADVQPDGMR